MPVSVGDSAKEVPVLGWALTFLVLAIIAGGVGFGGIAMVVRAFRERPSCGGAG
jgi:hypothetical protein